MTRISTVSWLLAAMFAFGMACQKDSDKPTGDGGDAGESATGGSASLGGGGGSVSLGSNSGGSSGAGQSGANGGGSGGVSFTWTGTSMCGNGLDDDGDDLVDGFDPECTSPNDNDEGSFATGISGDNRDPKWQDCFFDGNSGAGDDDCKYSTDCLLGTLAVTDPDCTVTQACLDFCSSMVPNGCDCFGCCELWVDGSPLYVAPSTDCSTDNLDDLTACPRCVQDDACVNLCGECEFCPGKTTLPSTCVTWECGGGEQVCGDGLPACPDGFYCSQGCCLDFQVILT